MVLGAVSFAVVVSSSCKDREDPPRGPVSENDQRAWSRAEPGQGGGAPFQMMPQQPRR
jgi:hypothetical protein